MVEVLVGMGVLAVALFPVVGYFASLQMSGESEEGDTEAISMASNVMENIISPTVPFDAIRPAGDGTGAGAVLTAGMTKSNGTPAVVQAGFTEGRWERLVSDEVSSGERVKVSRKGVRYTVYFFAGTYFNRDNVPGSANDRILPGGSTPDRPDVANELTFSFLPGPYGDRASSAFWKLSPTAATAANNAKVLPSAPALMITGVTGFSTLPYTLGGVKKEGAVTSWSSEASTRAWFYNDRDNYFRIPGWPTSPLSGGSYVVRSGSTDNRAELRDKLAAVASRTTAPTWGYHPVTLDQGKFIAQDKGALMKVVVGVKYRLHNFRSTSAPSGDQEFWLVSLKARLEDS